LGADIFGCICYNLDLQLPHPPIQSPHLPQLTVRASYEAPLRALLADMSDWQEPMRRFYQLLRHLVLANELCRRGVWGLEPHLLAIVNQLNRHASLRPHAEEF
jgi:hypothetical protein